MEKNIVYKVLLTDDEPLILSGMETIIDWSELGLEITGKASGGKEALSLLESKHFDILITDIRMQEMSGLELIKEIKRREIPLKIIVLSGHDDYAYLKGAFSLGVEDYFLKPVGEDELRKNLLFIVEKIESERKNSQLRKLMDSMILDNVLNSWIFMSDEESGLRGKLELFGIQLERKYYMVCIVRVEHLEYIGSQTNISCEYVRNIFQNLCGSEESVYVTFHLNGDLMVIYSSEWTPTMENFPVFVEIAMRQWLKEKSVRWFATVGNIVENPIHLFKSYQKAMELMMYKDILPYDQLVVTEERQKQGKHVLSNNDLDEKYLGGFLCTNQENSGERIDELRKKLTSFTCITAQEQNYYLGEVLYQIFLGARKMKRQNMENESIEVDCSSVFNQKNYNDKIKTICAILSDYIGNNPYGEDISHPLVMKVLQIIEEKYNQELSLKMLASQFHVSQTYLGRLFKKDTDSLFTEYLSRYRIQKARELLLTTDMKSRDIAIATGFSNPNYFANVFKKEVGVYPTKFRMQL